MSSDKKPLFAPPTSDHKGPENEKSNRGKKKIDEQGPQIFTSVIPGPQDLSPLKKHKNPSQRPAFFKSPKLNKKPKIGKKNHSRAPIIESNTKKNLTNEEAPTLGGKVVTGTVYISGGFVLLGVGLMIGGLISGMLPISLTGLAVTIIAGFLLSSITKCQNRIAAQKHQSKSLSK